MKARRGKLGGPSNIVQLIFTSCTAAFLWLLSAAAAMACSTSDFSVNLSNEVSTGVEMPDKTIIIRVAGEILSSCAEPSGVQVQFVFRDAAGSVLATEEPWPMSTRNILPHSSQPFSMMLDRPIATKTMTFSVIDVRHW